VVAKLFAGLLLSAGFLSITNMACAKEAEASAWASWDLVIVQLDNSNVPMNKFSISLEKSSTISKDNAPKISIDDLESSDKDQGRVIDIVCDTASIKQKFYSIGQLKGWASKMSCYGQNYYFIVNPATRTKENKSDH
jgi:hypothetical protein